MEMITNASKDKMGPENKEGCKYLGQENNKCLNPIIY